MNYRRITSIALAICCTVTIAGNVSYANWDGTEYLDGYQEQVGNGENSPYVLPNYTKTGDFKLYNNQSVKVYASTSTSSRVIGSFAPQLWSATKRVGDWFSVSTSRGAGWILSDTKIDSSIRPVALREIETVNDQLSIQEQTVIHTQPFEAYKTNQTLPIGTYTITQKAGDWYYIAGKGWVEALKATYPNTITKMTVDILPVSGRQVSIYQSIVKISEKVRPGQPLKPRYITIHNTGNSVGGTGAKSHADYLHAQASKNDRWASWHYTVDDREIYQHLPLNEHGWHAGDGSGPGNRSSIGIEIAQNKDGNYNRGQENAAYLTAALLHSYKVNYEQISAWVKPHKNWSGKNCPAVILGQPAGFEGFLNQVRSAYKVLEPIMRGVTTLKVNDMKKYDAGAGNHLTYINGKGYSQYFYENMAGTYYFIPQSWLKAAGLIVEIQEENETKKMVITNPYLSSAQTSQYPMPTSTVTVKQGKVNDMKKYDAGVGKHLTFINGRGYSQYFYENMNGTYQFIPQSWLIAAGLTAETKVSGGVKRLYITNPYMN